ncbi:MAG: hypothetical protein AB1679_09990 [Actinomycetota bacterium]
MSSPGTPVLSIAAIEWSGGLRVRFVVEVWRTEDDRVEGRLAPEGSSEMLPFSGWIELISLLEPPPLEITLPPEPTAEHVGPEVA